MLRLPFIAPYDWPLALRMIGAHAVPGGEVTDSLARTHRRLLPGDERRALLVEVSVAEGAVVVRIEAPGPPVSATESAEVETRVQHWLDLDADPGTLHRRFDADPVLAPLIAARPGLRRIRYPDAFEAVVSTVLGQQVSLAAARTFAGRLVTSYGETGPGGLTAFPTPEQLLAAEVEELRAAVGITGSRARTVFAVARLFSTIGPWPLPVPASEWDARAAMLLAVPGIGPWTAAYLRMRLFGDPDAVPVGDLVLRRALGIAKDRDVLAAMEDWRPERSYAVFQLWASTAW